MILPDWGAYLKSLGAELESQSQRVRQLIGSHHWLSDGQHKEALLRDLLRRHLPSSTLVTRGFVLDVGPDLRPSREQDILVVDISAAAPLFSTGELTISARGGALASFSVKSTLGRKELKDSIDTLLSIPTPPLSKESHPWLGGFFFGSDASFEPRKILNALKPFAVSLANVDTGPDGVIAAIASSDGLLFLLRKATDGHVTILGYKSQLATALFLAFVVDRVAMNKGQPHSVLGRLAEDFEAEQIGELTIPGAPDRRRESRQGKMKSARR